MNTKKMYTVDYVSEIGADGEHYKTMDIFPNKREAYTFAKFQATATGCEVVVGVANFYKKQIYKDSGWWNYEDCSGLYENYKQLYKLMRGYKFSTVLN